jgi:hypothetical protein
MLDSAVLPPPESAGIRTGPADRPRKCYFLTLEFITRLAHKRKSGKKPSYGGQITRKRIISKAVKKQRGALSDASLTDPPVDYSFA